MTLTRLDPNAYVLDTEAGQQNALRDLIAEFNELVDDVNASPNIIPLLGQAQAAGLLTGEQKMILTGGGNADALHQHVTAGGSQAPPTAEYIVAALDATLTNERVLQGTAGQILLTLAAGLATLALADTAVAPGTHTKVTVDQKGRVTAGAALAAADIPDLDAAKIASGLLDVARIPGLDAAKIVSGILNVARLGSGAADISKFLRGDGTWALPPGAGGGEANTASNVNVAGVGVFKQKTGLNLEFRGINAASSKVSIAHDAANNEIDIDVVTGVAAGTVAAGDHVHTEDKISQLAIVDDGNFGATKTLTFDKTKRFRKGTLTANTAITIDSMVNGEYFILELYTGAGGFNPTWIAGAGMGGITWHLNTTYVASAGAGLLDILSFYFDGTKIRASIIGQGHPA